MKQNEIDALGRMIAEGVQRQASAAQMSDEINKPLMPAHDYALQWARDTLSGKERGRFAWGDRNLARSYIAQREEIATLRTAHAESAWQPIETAPRDGTRILLYQPEGDGDDHERTVAEGLWGPWMCGECNWCMEGGDCWNKPTHWQPLPAPPDTAKAAINAEYAERCEQLSGAPK